MDEISDAIEEQQFESAALRIMKQSHHHSDGSEPLLTPVNSAQRSEIEARLATEEGQRNKSGIFEDGAKPVRRVSQPLDGSQQLSQSVKKEIAAGCNCGQFLFGRFSDAKNPSGGGFSVKSYSVSGAATIAYGASGTASEGYSVSGSSKAGYQ